MNSLRPSWVLMLKDAMQEQSKQNKKTFSLQWSLWEEWPRTASVRDVTGSLLGHFHSSINTQLIAAASTVLNWRPGGCFSLSMWFSEKPNAWTFCVCSTNCGSGCDSESRRWSSTRSCGCSSCRRSSCGSGFCCGWCCGLGCGCGCGWRGCSRMTRWWTGWRKGWVGSKGWVASWHCGQPKKMLSVKQTEA